MNIVYIEHYAGTPALGMEFRPYYLAREWVRAGHRVQMLAASYSHVRARQPEVGAKPLDEARAPALCDAVVTDASLPALLRAVDEVHVLTSLAGFEALLRGVKVVTHGSPFYAGWGLSEDRVATPRRTRRLTLDELVAGALIAYPTYVGRACGHFTTPERVVDDLVAWRPDDAASPWWWRHLAARLVPRRRA